jgi:serine phosphatase RsbU (regulator of sigma subunit)
MNFKKFILCISLTLTYTVSGTTRIDSLKSILYKLNGAKKVSALNSICFDYLYVNGDSALKYAKLGLELSIKENLKKDQGLILNNIGNIYFEKGEYSKALVNYIEAEKLFKIENFTTGEIMSSMNVGYVFQRQNLFDKALSQYTISLKIAEDNDNKEYMAQNLNNIGSLFYDKNEKKKALEYFSKSLKINEEINNLPRVMEGLNNVAIIYQELGNYSEALQNFKVFLNYSRKMSDKKNLVISYHNIALVYKDKKDYANAISYLDSSIFIAREIKDFDDLREAYSTLSEIYKEQNNYEKAFEAFQLSALAKDSLLNQTRDKQFIEMSTKYETEKKDAENKLLKTEGEKQRTLNIAITSGFILVAALAFFIFRGYQQKQKANILLEAQNTEISEKKSIIEEKQKEILDSISYAKRLQDAILPPLNLISQHLPSAFIYYQPKDIVAGDFYWLEHVGNTVFIAAADCTGHGVPGAMVSVVCSNALNRSVKEFGLTEPGKILDKTRELVLETFSKSETDVKDGMDISLSAISKTTGDQTGNELSTIQWSGANNPLWYLEPETGETMKEITASKQPIGKTEKPSPFTTHTLRLKKGDSLFLFTDGYADQFGGPKGKKFKYKQLKELLLKNSKLSSAEQKENLEQRFINWKGSLEQVDDVCVIGIKL